MRRLPSLARAWRVSDRLRLKAIRMASGREAADNVKLLYYRRDYFGDAFAAWMEAVLRGPSLWSVGERELLAAVVADLTGSRFCADKHAEVAAIELGSDLVAAVLADRCTAPIHGHLRVALDLAEALTLRPEDVGGADIAAALVAGVPVEAINDVVHICAAIATMGRVADAVGFTIPDDAALFASAHSALRRGYALR